jgi:hypothetical protein
MKLWTMFKKLPEPQRTGLIVLIVFVFAMLESVVETAFKGNWR